MGITSDSEIELELISINKLLDSLIVAFAKKMFLINCNSKKTPFVKESTSNYFLDCNLKR